jgi:hypothetical protein
MTWRWLSSSPGLGRVGLLDNPTDRAPSRRAGGRQPVQSTRFSTTTTDKARLPSCPCNHSRRPACSVRALPFDGSADIAPVDLTLDGADDQAVLDAFDISQSGRFCSGTSGIFPFRREIETHSASMHMVRRLGTSAPVLSIRAGQIVTFAGYPWRSMARTGALAQPPLARYGSRRVRVGLGRVDVR